MKKITFHIIMLQLTLALTSPIFAIEETPENPDTIKISLHKIFLEEKDQEKQKLLLGKIDYLKKQGLSDQEIIDKLAEEAEEESNDSTFLYRYLAWGTVGVAVLAAGVGLYWWLSSERSNDPAVVIPADPNYNYDTDYINPDFIVYPEYPALNLKPSVDRLIQTAYYSRGAMLDRDSFSPEDFVEAENTMRTFKNGQYADKIQKLHRMRSIFFLTKGFRL